jgi:hypothetical protein
MSGIDRAWVFYRFTRFGFWQLTHSGPNGAYLSGYQINVGRVRHVVCAVTHQPCRQALTEQCVVLLRNGWWVTHKTLTHPCIIPPH